MSQQQPDYPTYSGLELRGLGYLQQFQQEGRECGIQESVSSGRGLHNRFKVVDDVHLIILRATLKRIVDVLEMLLHLVRFDTLIHLLRRDILER